MTKRTSSAMIALVLGWWANPAFAHRLDEYLQASLVSIDPEHIRLQINLTPGVAVAEEVLAQIDRDHNDAISADEASSYAAMLNHDLAVRLDGRHVDLKLTTSNFPAPSELREGFGIIQMEFSLAPGLLAAGEHKLAIENRHLSTVSVYLINAAQPTSGTIQITKQNRNQNQSTGEIVFNFTPPANRSRAPEVGVWIAALLFAALALIWRAKEFAPATSQS